MKTNTTETTMYVVQNKHKDEPETEWTTVHDDKFGRNHEYLDAAQAQLKELREYFKELPDEQLRILKRTATVTEEVIVAM